MSTDLPAMHKWFAVECNNAGWKLTEQTRRTPEEAERMVHLAHAAAYHWSVVGTAQNVEKSWGLLGQAHAMAGNGAVAMKYAQMNFDAVMGSESADWEVAFAHLILSNAAVASGQAEDAVKYYTQAVEAMAAITEEEDREIVVASLQNALLTP